MCDATCVRKCVCVCIYVRLRVCVSVCDSGVCVCLSMCVSACVCVYELCKLSRKQRPVQSEWRDTKFMKTFLSYKPGARLCGAVTKKETGHWGRGEYSRFLVQLKVQRKLQFIKSVKKIQWTLRRQYVVETVTMANKQLWQDGRSTNLDRQSSIVSCFTCWCLSTLKNITLRERNSEFSITYWLTTYVKSLLSCLM